MKIHLKAFAGVAAAALSFGACSTLYPANGPRALSGDDRAKGSVEECRTLSLKYSRSSTITKIAGPLAAVGGVSAAILGASDRQGASGAAGGGAMLMAVTAAISGILTEKYTHTYLDRCTLNTGGDPLRLKSEREDENDDDDDDDKARKADQADDDDDDDDKARKADKADKKGKGDK